MGLVNRVRNKFKGVSLNEAQIQIKNTNKQKLL